MAIQFTKTLLASFALTLFSGASIANANNSSEAATQKVEPRNTEQKQVSAKEYQPSLIDAEGNPFITAKSLSDGKQRKLSSSSSNKAKNDLIATPKSSQNKTISLSREMARASDDPDFWIYDSYITLDADIDYDGYYSAFTLEFDVDTIYNQAAIYAEVYSTTTDVFSLFYTTDIYRINSDSTNDSIVIENTLLSGFPSNDYELMVVVYDADTDEVVAVSDGTDDADLAFISLESENYEYVEPVDVVVVERGGSTGVWLLVSLTLATLLRRAIIRAV
ncbi:choice-of-anchor H family protein [Glaciecola sp. MH2013]|uniref:choice-of-anchor H family protein n=1 Tax=Glaciecola sp. MH2013 TaxID=2785524 RepID=UPI00189ED9C0|nr:choice-of-anchor H family protein [Glaciecola sp. MH2013]MBF7074948.1 choice-of-anchor H family protein [Glaciecola sp. MH2013]